MDKEILSIVLSCLLLFSLVISIIFSLCIASKEQKENKKLKNEKLSLEIKKLKREMESD
ncbi:hypothetical protein [Spiroplasma endosymbiont of Glossina fuscipes fuscipes]|uniref:hypothetical protein n=1 Tax=Spiroplasma endosymbiont of Glossina fuscipes fuscipes TaxID=2004463 RepID=UPI003C751478